MIVLALAALLCVGNPSRVRQAEVELVGPLDDVRLVVAGRAETILHAKLVAGERTTLVVPLAAARDERELVLSEVPECAGSARWTGWVRDELNDAEQSFEALPIGLRTRARPALPRAAGERVSWAAWFLALGVVPLLLSVQRRTAVMGAVSGCAALAVFVLARSTVPVPSARVLECDADSGRWVAVDSARDELRAPCAVPLHFAVEPEHAFVQGELDRSALPSGMWTVRARGAIFLRWSAFDPGQRSLERTENRWGRIEALWLRSAEGVWSFHGEWELGRALPAARDAAPIDPPGWLNPALPLGTEILIARLAPGAFAGDGDVPTSVWIRRLGR